MSTKSPKDPLIVVLGATGTGKSQLAVELATKYNGEIINGDAMQMYEGLPIITNKITTVEQQGIPHHLLGLVRLEDETWTVGVFKKRANAVISDIRSRGKLPILVGGTHYYTQSLLFKENLITPENEAAERETKHLPREELNSKYPILEKSTNTILEELRLVDPIMADRWHPNDRRKIQRSLEIYLTTGRKASEMYQEQRERKESGDKAPSADDGEGSLLQSTLLFWVHADPEVLKPRLDSRVNKMVKNGLLDEVKCLHETAREQQSQGHVIDKTRGIWVSIGYKEFEGYLKALQNAPSSNTELTSLLDGAIERTKVATRQYSRRQVRWIRVKLTAALIGEGALQQLFVLDGSDIKLWDSAVSEKAFQITGQFLDGKKLPDPTTLCSAAAELLSAKQAYDHGDRPDLWIREHCEICNMTAVTKEQWDNHLKSRSHRGALKRRERRGTHPEPRASEYDSKESNAT